jgi:uncharacterized protein YecE (DUF72 family)
MTKREIVLKSTHKSGDDDDVRVKRRKVYDKGVPVKYRTSVTNVSGKQRKKPVKRVKHSNFAITVNTNQQIGPYEERLEPFCEQLEECFKVSVSHYPTYSRKDIFENLHDYVCVLDPEHEWERERVKRTDCETEVERGGKMNQIHAHALICVTHYTKVQLNIKELRAKICKDMGLKNVYIQIKILRGSPGSDRQRWQDYIRKNMK